MGPIANAPPPEQAPNSPQPGPPEPTQAAFCLDLLTVGFVAICGYSGIK